MGCGVDKGFLVGVVGVVMYGLDIWCKLREVCEGMYYGNGGLGGCWGFDYGREDIEGCLGKGCWLESGFFECLDGVEILEEIVFLRGL